MSKAEPTERIANALERIADSLKALETSAHLASQAGAWTAAREAAAAVCVTAAHEAGGSYPSDSATKRIHRARGLRSDVEQDALRTLMLVLYPTTTTEEG